MILAHQVSCSSNSSKAIFLMPFVVNIVRLCHSLVPNCLKEPMSLKQSKDRLYFVLLLSIKQQNYNFGAQWFVIFG